MKIIFLDIDGVLNCQNGYKEGYCKYVDLLIEGKNTHYQSFYPPSKKLLNELINKTNAKIVISSTWRKSGVERLKTIWKNENMCGEIIDITPSYRDNRFTVPRGCEINSWLEKGGFSHINWSEELQQQYVDNSGIENYLIIDDDSDMLFNQKNNFVLVEPSPKNCLGFNKNHYVKGLKILSKSIIELIYKK